MQAPTSVSNPLSVAASFILGLFKPDDLICIMKLRDGEPPAHIFLPANQVATKQFLSKLQAENEAGFNIYVCMNPFKADTKNRRKEFVARVAHVWCEMDDDSHLEEIKAASVLPKPHFILRSSEMGNHKTDGKANPTDKFHVIWNVEDMPLAELESLERALVAFGNDPQAVDAVRVLRIPGFKNCKYVEQPMVELVSRPDIDASDDVKPYRREDFKVETHAAAAEFKQTQQVSEEIHEGGRNAALASVAGKLRYSGFDAADIEESLQLFNQTHCVPPLGEDEVQTIARSVGRYPKNTPITIRLNGKEISTDPIRVVNGAAQQQTENATVEEYVVESAAASEYPQMGSDLISQWARGRVKGTGIPYGHVRECLKTVLAFCLDKTVKFPNHEHLFLRSWHFNLGESETCKTTALDVVKNEWSDELGRAFIHLERLSSYGSRQYLVKGFEEHSRMLLYVTEGHELATANENIPAIFGAFGDLYDQNYISAGSFKNKSSKCTNAEGSCIICFTPDDFTKALQAKGVIGGGILPRWTMSYSERILVEGDWAVPSTAVSVLQGVISERLNDCRRGLVKVVESEEAKAVRVALEKEIFAAERYGKRLIEHYKREVLLAAVFADPSELDEPVGVITAEIAEHAAQWVRYQLYLRQSFWPMDGGDKVERMESAILKVVNKAHPKAVPLKILRDVANVYREGSGGFECFNRAIKSLTFGKVIQQAGATRRGTPLFVLNAE